MYKGKIIKEEKIMFCGKCGAQLDENAKFCTNCGAQLKVRTDIPQSLVDNADPYQGYSYQEPYTPQSVPQQAAPASAQYSGIRPSAYKAGRGKYIVRRLIFCAIAATIWILAAVILGAKHRGGMAGGVSIDIINRLGNTVALIILPLIPAFLIGMFSGLAKSNAAKNIFRIISAVLRSLVPFTTGGALVLIFAVGLGLFPVTWMENVAVSNVLPLLTLFLPLCGYMINAAQINGRDQGLSASAGAVAAWTADKMPVIVIAEAITEFAFSVPGLGYYSYAALNMLNFRAMGLAMICLAVLTSLLKLLMDVLAALFAGGDPASLVYSKPDDSSGKILLIVGASVSALFIVIAFVLPFFSSGDVVVVNPFDYLIPPGGKGYLLGTDQMGRDFFAMLSAGMRNTVIMALTNTIVAVVIGTGFGLLAGIIRGAAANIFRAIAYVFGHGTCLALIFLIFTGKLGTSMGFVAVGLFAWGGIADRVSLAMMTKRNTGKTVFMIPVLEQVVQAFCASFIWTSALGYCGLSYYSPSFPTLGNLIGQGRVVAVNAGYLYSWPIVMFTLMLCAFYLLHAGLCARERYSG